MWFNAFSETEGVTGKHWGHTVNSIPYTISDSTGRINTAGYDAAGNLVSERVEYTPSVINRTLRYDAAGRNVQTYDPAVHTCCENHHTYDDTFDGNGWRVRNIDTSDPPSPSVPAFTDTKYEFRSTAFGGEIVGKLAIASWHTNQTTQFITPINGVMWGEDKVAWSAPEGIRTYGQAGTELDTRGADVGMENPYNTGDGSTGYPGSGGDPLNPHGCAAGGMSEPCDPEARAQQAFANRRSVGTG